MQRRVFLGSGGIALLAASVGGVPSFLTRAAAATPRGPFRRRKVLVTLFQRGAMDGLAAVQPLGDPHLARLRPTLALDRAGGLLDLDGRYGLHPALGPLAGLFGEGRLGVVHGVGSPVPTRSHFDAQDFMESGRPGDKGADTGWLNRATGLLGHEPETPFQAVALTPGLPLALRGDAPALAIADLDDFGVGRGTAARAAGQGLEALYAETAADLLGSAGREGLDAARALESARLADDPPEFGAAYPRSELGDSLRQIARLIKADVGLEVAFAETGGWDTHARQGADQGSFARRADDLAHALAAFWTDLGRYHDDVVVLTMTEFGRTVAENGTGGTDHGRASALFVLGNAVRGGEVHGAPLVLDPDALEDGRDLPVTTDFRAVFAGVAGGHLGIPTGGDLFPGWAGAPLDLIRR